jgi:quinol monooxygenase YgiN
VATNNLEWYIFGIWDSYADYMEHFHSKHCQKLRQWDADHDVVWKRSTLIVMSPQV